MNKGFTLVELLAVIVILAIIGGIGVVSYTSITKKSEGDYYINLINNLELGAANYFTNNRIFFHFAYLQILYLLL